MSDDASVTGTQVQEQVVKAQEVVNSLLRQTHVAVPDKPTLLTELHRIQGHLSYVLQVLREQTPTT